MAGSMKDKDRLDGLRTILDGASPSVRRAAISLAIHEDLERARTAYTAAYEAGQRYKANLIRANAQATKTSAEHLDAALEVSMLLGELAALLVRAASEADARADTLKLVTTQLGAVCGPWQGCARDLESGAGLSGYDDADGVARAKADAVRLHEQFLARKKTSPKA